MTPKGWVTVGTLQFGACALFFLCAAAPMTHARQQTPADQASTGTPSSKTSATHKAHSVAAGSKSAGTTHTASTGSKRPTSRRKKTVKTRGQQKIDSDRAQAIQEALIRENYLSGEATGKWSDATETALRRYQSDHGWQSKTVPDSRALISLGLGPSHDHLLNPESAMTTTPDAPRAAPASHTNTAPTTPADAPASQSDPSRPQ